MDGISALITLPPSLATGACAYARAGVGARFVALFALGLLSAGWDDAAFVLCSRSLIPFHALTSHLDHEGIVAEALPGLAYAGLSRVISNLPLQAGRNVGVVPLYVEYASRCGLEPTPPRLGWLITCAAALLTSTALDRSRVLMTLVRGPKETRMSGQEHCV